MKNLFLIVALACLLTLSQIGLTQTVKEVFAFSNANSSATPSGPLVQGRDGKLYGTTNGVGQTIVTDGTVFRLSTAGKWSSLHAFAGTDGANPSAGLLLATDGNYYGTAQYGGNTGWGLLFKITPTGVFTILYQFTGGADGGHPAAALIQASDGNLYGTTFPGTLDSGTVYKYAPLTGTFSTILSLSQDGSQGQQISAPVVQAADGNLYGTAIFGGANGCGSIFRIATTGTLLQVYSFPCGAGGSAPSGPLLQASDGNLYGTTSVGGNVTSQGECQSGCGTIFRLSHGLVTVLYRFSGYPSDGGIVASGLVQGTDGNLYGGTFKGGANDQGVLYQITITGQYKLLYSFAEPIGHGADSAPMQHTNGKFYGVTTYGGRYLEGAMYSLDMGLGPFIALGRYTGRIGQPVPILGQGLIGSTSVTVNGVPATSFKVFSNTYMTAVIPAGATTGPVIVTTPNGNLTSNHNLRVVP